MCEAELMKESCSYEVTCHSLDVDSVYPPVSAVKLAKRRETQKIREISFLYGFGNYKMLE